MSNPAFFGPPSSKPSRQHRFSNSNSLSSSSIVTVQRAATPQSPLGSQTNSQGIAGGRYDPQEGKVKISPERKRRSGAAQNRSSSAAGVREGVGNLNRWSQSTGSSSSTHNRRNSFSKRLSFGGSNPFSGLAGQATSPPSQRNVLTKSRPSTAEESSRRRPPPQNLAPNSTSATAPPSLPPTTLLPPILTLPSLTSAVNAADSSTPATITPSTAGLLTPSTFASPGADYFGEVNKNLQGNSPPRKRSSPQPTRVAPSPVSPGPNRRLGSDPRLSPAEGSSLSAQSARQRPTEATAGSSRGHSRSREADGKGSGNTDSSVSSHKSRDKERAHGSKHPSQKAMLSKALQKANTAVLLDNAQNFEGAIDAYKDACGLLQKVMSKSSANEEKKKLEAIRNTYTNRIAELAAVNAANASAKVDGKALPARPESNDYAARDSVQSVVAEANDEGYNAGPTASAAQRVTSRQSFLADPRRSNSPSTSHVPPRRESLIPSFDFVEEFVLSTTPAESQPETRPYPRSPLHEQSNENTVTLRPPMERDYMPPPLSPRRPSSPMVPEPSDNLGQFDFEGPPESERAQPVRAGRARAGSTESTSWLDTIDESGGSSASSVHSRSSSTGVRRKRIRAASGATEAEFDAALDAAVEAAYDDGYEPVEDPLHFQTQVISNVRRNVEIAKQKAREAEREAEMQLEKQRERERLLGNIVRTRSDSIDLEYDDAEAEEEERMLEEMTRGFVMDDSEYDVQSKSALPRQSDSSGFSGRTWGSSIGSNPTTAATSLQTLPETQALPPLAPHLQSKVPQPLHPPPAGAPPPPPGGMSKSAPAPPPPPPTSAPPRPPTKARSKPPSLSRPVSQSVRSRRLSGQQHKQLKIETSTKPPRDQQAPLTQPLAPSQVHRSEKDLVQPMTASVIPSTTQTKTTFNLSAEDLSTTLGSRQEARAASHNMNPIEDGIGALRPSKSQDSIDPIMESPERSAGRAPLGNLRKNFSSSSLKNRNVPVSSPEASENSPGTPLGGSFSTSASMHMRRAHTPSVPTLPTPTLGAFQMTGLPTGGGLHLFESNIHSPNSPGSPNPHAANAPIPLEPCPTETILRPFWLMRCFYQTITHPRGGYLSTKLFVPRDVWRVKNVKIKGVEEKISNCDLLTAALQNLGQVDTVDADSVLDEMQSLETVLDQVQASLQKKLGNEVGVHGSMAMFKDARAEGGDINGDMSSSSNSAPGSANMPSGKATNSSSGKSGYLSWKRLRSKNSGAGLTNSFTAPKDGSKDTLNMASLPMTSAPTMRFVRRDISKDQLTGPNAAYMNALARLFDAAQVLDQIARQVEDPGLRHSSPTQVGLELSTRHAAEFFGFYVCRFVLVDISTMIDKFIKRGSEWVLA
ncbi:MAG: hypothetical protein M4579_000360 [Chaenotheca gracillima]|nr:MAG: hypothetical protein M4579_000360 [Chaenotheca gracillima]